MGRFSSQVCVAWETRRLRRTGSPRGCAPCHSCPFKSAPKSWLDGIATPGAPGKRSGRRSSGGGRRQRQRQVSWPCRRLGRKAANMDKEEAEDDDEATRPSLQGDNAMIQKRNAFWKSSMYVHNRRRQLCIKNVAETGSANISERNNILASPASAVASASTTSKWPRARSVAERQSASTTSEGTRAAVKALVRTGSKSTCVRTAGAKASESTTGKGIRARSVAEHPSVSTTASSVSSSLLENEKIHFLPRASREPLARACFLSVACCTRRRRRSSGHVAGIVVLYPYKW